MPFDVTIGPTTTVVDAPLLEAGAVAAVSAQTSLADAHQKLDRLLATVEADPWIEFVIGPVTEQSQ